MKYLFLTSTVLLVLFSGCGTTNGGCCESMNAKSSGTVPAVKPVPYLVKTGTPVQNPDVKPLSKLDTNLPPVAVIKPDLQTLRTDEYTTFNCRDSYDRDENGASIVACEWTFECHKKDGYTCNCPKKGNMKIDVSIKPHPNADYVIATLTVTDDEGETNTTSQRFDIAN